MGSNKRYQEEREALGWFPIDDKYVCPDCLNDPLLAAAVRDAAEVETCSYCLRPGSSLAAPVDVVLELVVPGIRSEYEDPINGAGWDDGWTVHTTDTFDLLQDYEVTENGDLLEDLTRAIITTEWCQIDPYAAAPHEALLWGWQGFREYVKHRVRYMFLDPAPAKPSAGAGEIAPDQMPAALTSSIEDGGLARLLAAGSTFYRGRPHPADRRPSSAGDLGSPPDQLAKTNRMTPAGVSAFYGASTRDGALAEVRAYAPKDDVSVGRFSTARPMLVIDLVDVPALPSAFDERRRRLRPAIRFLRAFTADVATPAHPDDREHLDYVPTQVVAEYLKHRFQHPDGPVMGVLWRSSLDREVTCCVLFVDNAGCVAAEEGWQTNLRAWVGLIPNSVEHLPASTSEGSSRCRDGDENRQSAPAT